MEESHHLVQTPSPVVSTARMNESTLSNSETSTLTAENSTHIFKPSAKASPDYEKHNQYLNRLEASFVKQLHESMDLLAWLSEQNVNARNLSTEQLADFASDQFPVLHGCHWQTLNFGKTTAVGSHGILNNSWIKHFRRAGRPVSTELIDIPECCSTREEEKSSREQNITSHRLGRFPEHLPVNYSRYCHPYESVAEGSGQNFVEKDHEDDSISQTEKLKTAVLDD